MELATGKIRYEFSGPGALGWYAAFVPDGSAFLASRLFEQAVNVWPTAHAPREHRTPPEPTRKLEGFERTPREADVASSGMTAFALDGGTVVLKRPGGVAPKLAPPEGAGGVRVAFTPSGGHVVALRAGRVFAWALTEAPRTDPDPVLTPPTAR